MHEKGTDGFESIPSTIWECIQTATSGGYGDNYPVTTAGRGLDLVVMLTGVTILARSA